MAMFGNMLWQTYLVAAQAQSLREVVTLLWMFKLPWAWAYTAGSSSAWVQAKNLVYLLPDGYYDADDLQNEKIACEKFTSI